MADTDALNTKALAEIGAIEVPSREDVISAAEMVKTTAEKAKRRQDDRMVTASAGQYTPQDYDFDWIVAYFTKFHERDGAEPARMADQLGRVRQRLLTGRDAAVAALNAAVRNWSGEARDSFHTYFVTPFPDAVTNQTEVVDELRISLWAYQAVLGHARRDAKVIATKAADLLESLDDFKVSDATVALAVVGAAESVTSALSTEAVLGLPLLAGGDMEPSSVAAVQDLEGYDVISVLDSMKKLLDAVEQAMSEEEERLGRQLADGNAVIEQILAVGPHAHAQPARTTLLPAEPESQAAGSQLTSGDFTVDPAKLSPPS
jgi:ribosomal 50S subunit-associated protein YjgA (DUF615 family)